MSITSPSPSFTSLPFTTLSHPPLRRGIRGGRGHSPTLSWCCPSLDESPCGTGFKEEISGRQRSEEHTSGLPSPDHLVCRLLLVTTKHIPTSHTTDILTTHRIAH